MEKKRFPIGFWNYVEMGRIPTGDAVRDWVTLGMSLAMSFDYDAAKHRPEQMTELLDACAHAGISAIVCDKRTHWRTLTELGEAAFTEGVQAAGREFGAHPAATAFHVGDEPNKDELEDMERACRIVGEHAGKPAFVNFYPSWAYDDFKDLMGVDHSAYASLLNDSARRAGLTVLSYDCYTQLYERNREEGLNAYFKNLNVFRGVADRRGIPMWTSLLSVGHWCYRVPTEDDLRWQISTAVAHGAEGLLWFYLYERTLDTSYRLSPIDLFWERTETFDRLSRQNRIFQTYYGEKLAGRRLAEVRHFLRQYGGTPAYEDGCDARIEKVVSAQYEPLAISRFEGRETGETSYLVVNLSQQNSTRVKIAFTERYAAANFDGWLAPGQLALLELGEERK